MRTRIEPLLAGFLRRRAKLWRAFEQALDDRDHGAAGDVAEAQVRAERLAAVLKGRA